MRRTGIYLLVATVLTVAYAAMPGVARADDVRQRWGISELGETCAGKCAKGLLCCTTTVAPPA